MAAVRVFTNLNVGGIAPGSFQKSAVSTSSVSSMTSRRRRGDWETHSGHGRPCCGVTIDGGCMRRRRTASVVRAGTSLLTASRVAEGSESVRIWGRGTAGVDGVDELIGCGGSLSLPSMMKLSAVGRLLAFDEFFEYPTTNGLLLRDSDTLLESLIYYCDDPEPSEIESYDEAQSLNFGPRHGVHLYLKSNMLSMMEASQSVKSAPKNSGSSFQIEGLSVVSETPANVESLVPPMITHVREASTVPLLSLDGGAGVRVVAGKFSNITTPPPLQDFVMLDVLMRPGSDDTLPLEPHFGVLIYILEGVGIFEPTRFEEDHLPFYQNEGHGLYIPPARKRGEDILRVRTHEWSHLRFLLVGSPVS